MLFGWLDYIYDVSLVSYIYCSCLVFLYLQTHKFKMGNGENIHMQLSFVIFLAEKSE